MLYGTAAFSFVFALDAVTGEEIWRWDPAIPHEEQGGPPSCCGDVNRGVALDGDNVFVGLLDGRLVALDRADGSLVWTVQTTPPGSDYTITGAPRVIGNSVVIGNGGAEYGVRGYVTAYDTRVRGPTMAHPHRPREPRRRLRERGNARRGRDLDGRVVGRRAAAGPSGTRWWWTRRQDLLYIGTGNGSPWNRDNRSPGGGDNLYLSAIVALDPSDGSFEWHYQTTPGDDWDYTATQPLMLLDLEIGGQERQVIVQAPKNGFFYVVDRLTGELISAEPFTDDLTWATAVNPKTSRPIETPEARYGMTGKGVYLAPGPRGAPQLAPHVVEPAHRAGLSPRDQQQLLLREGRGLRLPGGHLEHRDRPAAQAASARNAPAAPGAEQCASGVGSGGERREVADRGPRRSRGEPWPPPATWCSGARVRGWPRSTPAPARSSGRRMSGQAPRHRSPTRWTARSTSPSRPGWSPVAGRRASGPSRWTRMRRPPRTSPPPPPRRSASPARSSTRIGPTMQQFIDNERTAGIMTLVARSGEIVHWDAHGWRVRDEDPLEPNDIFRIYSMTKPVTSVAAMILVEEGRLSLDDPAVQRHPRIRRCPGVRRRAPPPAGAPDPDPRPACPTLRASPTASSANTPVDSLYRSSLNALDRRGGSDLEERAEVLASLPLIDDPGARWNYSLSTDVLGRVVEVVSGQSLDAFFRERIFEPLGMHDTGFHVVEGKTDRFTQVYFRGRDGLVAPPSPNGDRFTRPPSWFSGGGGPHLDGGRLPALLRDAARRGREGRRPHPEAGNRRALMTRNHLPDEMIPIPGTRGPGLRARIRRVGR